MAQAATRIDNAVDHQGFRREREAGYVCHPGEPQLLDVGVIDPGERAVVLPGEASAVDEPVLAGVRLRENACLRHIAESLRRGFRFSRLPELQRKKGGRNDQQKVSKPLREPPPPPQWHLLKKRRHLLKEAVFGCGDFLMRGMVRLRMRMRWPWPVFPVSTCRSVGGRPEGRNGPAAPPVGFARYCRTHGA